MVTTQRKLLDLPAEVLQLVFESELTKSDLWALYHTSQTLRVHAVRLLFRETFIKFQKNVPISLNFRRLPVRTIIDALLRELSHIRDLYLSTSSCTSPTSFLDLLGRIPNLKCCVIDTPRDYRISEPNTCSALDLSSYLWPSCSFQSLERLIIEVTFTWTIPSLPALRDLSIDFEKNIGGSSILIDLTKLPRLSSFELEEYAGEGLTLLGSSSTVKKQITGAFEFGRGYHHGAVQA
ncbi:hypothetical protein EYB26_003633 [Talaromyces marneffei]|uniref:uncharacterized protein n=1 Tax=Talaromyces marneffei TaxID=37727 RepID=UPI0012A7C51E|nr:uncharacterized protein EYB26_003633 [Talaromyces marneffei]QGA15966.1 hypothetical protein EYB26_003633 [Talaromyces marneffei]